MARCFIIKVMMSWWNERGQCCLQNSLFGCCDSLSDRTWTNKSNDAVVHTSVQQLSSNIRCTWRIKLPFILTFAYKNWLWNAEVNVELKQNHCSIAVALTNSHRNTKCKIGYFRTRVKERWNYNFEYTAVQYN